MSRIGNYANDDLVSWFAASPELGGALANFSDAVYHRSRLPLRVRELARTVIALDNECAVCENTRFNEGPAAGVDEEFYAHVPEWRTWSEYSPETPCRRVRAAVRRRPHRPARGRGLLVALRRGLL